MKTKCSFIVAALVLTICLSTAWTQNIDFASIQIQTIKVADGLYVLMGGPAQGNILASIGSDGVFLIDSMYAPMHPKIMDALAKLSSQPVRYVVNTHLHGDHTAGNEAMAKLGAVIISHDNMRKRMAAQQNNVPPSAALPTITYTDDLTLYFNGEEIYIYHPAPAHTDGDSIIYFRHANVMHVGDIPASLRYPNIGVTDGGTVDGMIAAAQQVMKIANTETKIIPGHLGPVVGFKEIRQQLDMFAAMRDRIDVAIRAGKTPEQVVASKPTVDFDAGRLGGAITPDRFVTLVYTDRAQRAAGAEAYRSKCASCHGSDAKGTAAGGNLTRLSAAGAVDQQIYQIIRRGIPNTLKPHSFGPEPQVAQIVTYLRTLSIDNSNNRRLANSENGARLFRENCSSCHQINAAAAVRDPISRRSEQRDPADCWLTRSVTRVPISSASMPAAMC
jgi:cyclase